MLIDRVRSICLGEGCHYNQTYLIIFQVSFTLLNFKKLFNERISHLNMVLLEAQISYHMIIQNFCTKLKNLSDKRGNYIGGMVQTCENLGNPAIFLMQIDYFESFLLKNTQEKTIMVYLVDEIEELLWFIFRFYGSCKKTFTNLVAYYTSKCRNCNKQNIYEYINLLYKCLNLKVTIFSYPTNQIETNEYIYKFYHDRNVVIEQCLLRYKFEFLNHMRCVVKTTEMLNIMKDIQKDVLDMFGEENSLQSRLFIEYVFENVYYVVRNNYFLETLVAFIYQIKNNVELEDIQHQIYTLYETDRVCHHIQGFYQHVFVKIYEKFHRFSVQRKECIQRANTRLEKCRSLDLDSIDDHMPFKLLSSPKRKRTDNFSRVIAFSPLEKRLSTVAKGTLHKSTRKLDFN
ncbi:hypothetical protein VCUG_02006 [Vavraia culicis subsp. floridensis]|uniref:Uncharacterized protein n=1 Tax=Vavraia culicis (isolate floridensis) TaxID=948595 RepID=L2GSB1_VAVCU|nr:uncharacterized protein VCUG_02006 [Vavraia culicis subsp. floridensis]ELA46514.1 hypothetical protein VCUG_02006 [Vavraia culicis subsp. floridensis]